MKIKILELNFYTLSYTHKKKSVIFMDWVYLPQPSPAQPSPNKPNAVFSLQIVTYIIRQISLLSEINKHWQRLSLSNTHHY